MTRILITGATGNIGLSVVRYLSKQSGTNQIVIGVRSIGKAKAIFKDYKNLDYTYFDFENPESFDIALNGIERVFLLRPPHISDVDKYFRPLISESRKK